MSIHNSKHLTKIAPHNTANCRTASHAEGGDCGTRMKFIACVVLDREPFVTEQAEAIVTKHLVDPTTLVIHWGSLSNDADPLLQKLTELGPFHTAELIAQFALSEAAKYPSIQQVYEALCEVARKIRTADWVTSCRCLWSGVGYRRSVTSGQRNDDHHQTTCSLWPSWRMFTATYRRVR